MTTKPPELPACPRHADQLHRFNRHGIEVQMFDDIGLVAGIGLAYQCPCGAALINADHLGPGYQLAAPLPDLGPYAAGFAGYELG